MAVTFAASELSGVSLFGVPLELTSAGIFRTAYSRLGLSVLNSTSGYIATAPAAITDGWVRFNVYGIFDTDNNPRIVEVRNSSDVPMLRLYGASDGNIGQFQYWNGTTWVQIGSSWTYAPYGNVALEVAIKITCGSPGTATLFFNGTQMATGSIGATMANFQSLVMSNADDSGGTLTNTYSEIIFSNTPASMIGSAVETEAPTGNGADSTDGIGAYTDIDDVATNDADVLIFTAAGQRRSFTSPARTGTLGAVLGISVAARAIRGSSGPTKIKFYLTISGTRYYSPDISLTLGFSGYQYTWAVNPATSLAWTSTDANAATLEWGIEAVA